MRWPALMLIATIISIVVYLPAMAQTLEIHRSQDGRTSDYVLKGKMPMSSAVGTVLAPAFHYYTEDWDKYLDLLRQLSIEPHSEAERSFGQFCAPRTSAGDLSLCGVMKTRTMTNCRKPWHGIDADRWSNRAKFTKPW